ncbi:hypothetical protein OEZ85_007654 [Tetradesmus obliquus]|uniref:Uncharacterized protein n=1 Tax=Tetradesmus obliquus TaxID=3088 RepID=A0ABY8TGV7_TETOB|nr:hypothetical protein OEZ85_007654 [Tetradesmus obliquus]
MATLDESVSDDAAWDENEFLSPVPTCYGSLVELLMCGDYEQHLSPIFKGSSSSIYIVSPLVCAEPTFMPEPSLMQQAQQQGQPASAGPAGAAGRMVTTNSVEEHWTELISYSFQDLPMQLQQSGQVPAQQQFGQPAAVSQPGSPVTPVRGGIRPGSGRAGLPAGAAVDRTLVRAGRQA